MTFESMNDVAPTNASPNSSYPVLPASANPLNPALATPTLPSQVTPPPTTNEVIVKAFFGSDIRRATFSGGYAPLHEVCTKIYAIDPATTVLKYQDEEGDKITMSTDAELQEALKLAKDKVLRVYVETKAAPVIPAQEEAWGNRLRHGPMRGHRGGFGFGGYGGFGRRGGFPHGPHPHPHGPHHHPHPPHGDHGFPHAHTHTHAHPHPPHGDHGFPPAHPSNDHPVQTAQHELEQQAGSNASYTTARVHAHGHFSPVDSSPSHCKSARADASPYPRYDWKDRKCAMKEQFKYMKENNCMDKFEFKELKQRMKDQMYIECRTDKEQMKVLKKAKKAAKAEKYGKCDNHDNHEKKHKDKKDKKDKKEKKEKKEKKDKDERLVARHVADVTVPDNSELGANVPVTKTWRLRNDGALAWPAESQLLFVSHRGDYLNGPERVHVGAVEPQKEVDVSVTFVTPIEPGRYTGYYRMATGEGRKFGQRVWVSFIIAQPAAATVAGDAHAHERLLDVNME